MSKLNTNTDINWNLRRKNRSLTELDIETVVHVFGWVDAVRDHGDLLFVHLRDVSGIIQLVFDANVSKELYDAAQQLRSEWVISVKGTVFKRSRETINPQLKTGDIEVKALKLKVLNKAKTPPFMVSEKDILGQKTSQSDIDEELRLTYRYLDLRRPSMQTLFFKRSEIIQCIHHYLTESEFINIETPVLTKSTPEGARDYLVPSRTHPKRFFALPQSPQLFKQLLMCSGFEKYYQVVKCFRDEDLRPNRQPEFTQLDLEASFIDESYIFTLLEGLMKIVYKKIGVDLKTPFPKLSYAEAMDLYGSENPDLRFDLKLIDVSETVKECNYKIFKSILSKKGLIKGFALKGASKNLSKNVLQNELAIKTIQKLGGKGLTWMRVEDNDCVSNIVQFFSQDERQALIKRLGAENGDVIFMVADTNHALVNQVLGRFRVHVAERQGLIDTHKICPVWITEFPLFELKNGCLSSMHHPFTQASEEISSNMSLSDLLKIKARAYDLVLNGEEIGGGSLRIHKSIEQKEVLKILGLSDKEINEKFGFFIEALEHGAPPHGGLALGLDRLLSIMLKTESIRDVIAFPKNRTAYCPLTKAPSQVDTNQLADLSLKLTEKL